MPVLPILYDLPELVLLGVVTGLTLTGTWAAVGGRSASAAWLRRIWGRPGAGQLVVCLLAASVLVMIVEDVVNRRHDELVLRLDGLVQSWAQLGSASRTARELASLVSRLTGEGLVGAVLAAAAVLAATRRRHEAIVVVAGTSSAWLLSAALTMAFGIARPAAHRTWYEITGYGFPSAHALVAVVACGLLAWAVGRTVSRRTRAIGYAGAGTVAALAGGARLLLNAHWLSDVLAGLAMGVVWLNVVIYLAGLRERPTPWPNGSARRHAPRLTLGRIPLLAGPKGSASERARSRSLRTATRSGVAAKIAAGVDRRPARAAVALDPTVRALGVVTLLNDLSSEVAVRTLPLFLANVLGVSAAIIGLIEGLAESTATVLKVVSGYLADRIGRKKTLALWGYGLSNLTKPLLFFATGWGVVLAVRCLDRVGKGMRTAPRDALIAAASAPEHRGRAFGFTKAMDKAGAVVGLLVAAGILYGSQGESLTLTRQSYQWLILLAVLPGLASVAVLARWVEERPAVPGTASGGLVWRQMPGRFWAYVAVLIVFTLGNSSDAFLMLRAQTVGFTAGEVFLVVALFSLVIALTSTWGGALSDACGRRGLIVVGWLVYAAIYLGFAHASARWHIWALYAGYGLYYGAFQGTAAALVADMVPEDVRGTGYGIFNGALGVAAFPASLLAGLLWDWYGPAVPFLVGGTLALLASAALLVIPSDRQAPGR